EELRAVWQAADATEGHFGDIVKLLILTGQRRSEIAALRREWIQIPSSSRQQLSSSVACPSISAGFLGALSSSKTTATGNSTSTTEHCALRGGEFDTHATTSNGAVVSPSQSAENTDCEVARLLVAEETPSKHRCECTITIP